jgi:hypothetical protein
VGVDLGDRWSQYCILGLEGETLAEGQLRTRQEDVREFGFATVVVFSKDLANERDGTLLWRHGLQAFVVSVGEGGIRTLGTGISQYNGLANGPFSPPSLVFKYLQSDRWPPSRTQSSHSAVIVLRFVLHRWLWTSHGELGSLFNRAHFNRCLS